jgi:hypothetical protein
LKPEVHQRVGITPELEDKIKELPPDLRQEVEDFVQFLIEKRIVKPRRPLKLDWRGALEDMKDEYTSVELQHKISEWRTEEDVSS